MAGVTLQPSALAVTMCLVLLLVPLSGCQTGTDSAGPQDGGDGTVPPGEDPPKNGHLPLEDLPSVNGTRMVELAREQIVAPNGTVRYRVPGTPGHAATVPVLERMVQGANLTAELERFQAEVSELGRVNLTNVYGTRDGRQQDAGEIWLAAHWDSRAWADATGPSCEGPPVQGANDGAAAVAVVLHAAARLPQLNHKLKVALFDAEDQGCNGHGWIVGSSHAAQRLEAASGTDRVRALLVVDMPAASTLTIPREGNSADQAPRLTDLVFQVAEQLDARAFRNTTGPPITDDHVPFLEAGVPAVDLIHLDSNGTSVFPWMWHTEQDTLDRLHGPSMEQVTRVVMGTVLAIDRGQQARSFA